MRSSLKIIESMGFRTNRWAAAPGVPVTVLLLAVLLAVNAVAVWGILAARESARRLAQNDLELQTTAHARALEAVLATLRGDLIFLSQSPPLAKSLPAMDSDDPMVRRWGRLDLDGTLLLFMAAHPAVERLVVRDGAGLPLVAAGRREGAPVLLPRADAELPAEETTAYLLGRWPVAPAEEGGASLTAAIDVSDLLAAAAPGLEGRLVLERGPAAVISDAASPSAFRVAVPVVDASWEPPIRWWLVRRESESRFVASVERLAGRYRATVLLNLAVITLTLLLGFLAFRQVRRTAQLEAENRQQSRVRELERQLMHSERLASVGRLAAGMAHEINNPLEGMSNYLTILEQDLAAGEVADAPSLAARVREGLVRVAGIIRQVLAFADPGRAPKASLDLADVLARTVDFVRGNPAFRKVELRLAAAEALPVEGNAITLGQLFLNLILNACQAQPDGGEIEVSARRDGGRAVVEVADRGPGLPPEVLSHIFEPFYSTKGSTGLGLAVCHGIVADHQGEIGAANRPGGGARFEVALPLGPALESPGPAAPTAMAERPGPAPSLTLGLDARRGTVP